jgi:hypothetical protein
MPDIRLAASQVVAVFNVPALVTTRLSLVALPRSS